jgi:hypothetical protein
MFEQAKIEAKSIRKNENIDNTSYIIILNSRIEFNLYQIFTKLKFSESLIEFIICKLKNSLTFFQSK